MAFSNILVNNFQDVCNLISLHLFLFLLLDSPSVCFCAGDRLTCYTGLKAKRLPGYPVSWPLFEFTMQEDKCFEPSKRCVSLEYTMHFYYGFFPLKVTEAICQDPRIPCSQYCEKFGEVKSISGCKVSISP